MYIETKRLVLRSLQENDADALFSIKTDPQVLKYCQNFLKYDMDEDEAVSFIREFNRLEENNDFIQWRCYAITDKQTGEIMGSLSFGRHNMLFEYELGWQIKEQFTKKGYASEAAQVFAEWFCETQGVDYLIAVMDVDNPSSYKSALKGIPKYFV